MLKGKLIALTAALAFVVMALPAGASNISLGQPGGDTVAAVPSDTLILNNTWRIEVGETADAWAWTIGCTGCTIAAVNMNYAFGAPPAPPSTPGNVLWQAPTTRTRAATRVRSVAQAPVAPSRVTASTCS